MDKSEQKAVGRKHKAVGRRQLSALGLRMFDKAAVSDGCEPGQAAVATREDDSVQIIPKREWFASTTSKQLSAFCFLPTAFCFLSSAFFGGLADLGNALMAYGAFGLFAISFLDSAFVPLPSGPDLVMIALSASNHTMMPLYALAATVGSTIGCTILYLIARCAGMAALRRIRPERRDKIENLLGRYDMLAVMIPAILPPPFPFKPFVLAAGAFKFKIPRFVAAIFIGRAIRFLLEGWLAIRFGQEAFQLIKQNGLTVLLVVLLLLLIFFAVQFYRKKRGKQVIDLEESLPPLQ